jgi:hypothetical protein
VAKQSNNGHDKNNGYETPDVYMTSKGAKVTFVGLNPVRLEKIQNAGKLPPVPTRSMETAFGEEQKEELTADSLQNDEEKKQWAEYVKERDAILNKRNENVLKYVFFDGIKIDDSTIDEWKAEQEEVWGIEVPNNRVDLKVDYINSEVIGNPEDLGNIMAGVMERTGVPAEMLDELRASFRGTLRRDIAREAATESGAEE